MKKITLEANFSVSFLNFKGDGDFPVVNDSALGQCLEDGQEDQDSPRLQGPQLCRSITTTGHSQGNRAISEECICDFCVSTLFHAN